MGILSGFDVANDGYCSLKGMRVKDRGPKRCFSHIYGKTYLPFPPTIFFYDEYTTSTNALSRFGITTCRAIAFRWSWVPEDACDSRDEFFRG